MAGTIAGTKVVGFVVVAPFVGSLYYRALAVVPASRNGIGFGEGVEVLRPWGLDGIARRGEVTDFRRSASLVGGTVGHHIELIVSVGIQSCQGVGGSVGNAYFGVFIITALFPIECPVGFSCHAVGLPM